MGREGANAEEEEVGKRAEGCAAAAPVAAAAAAAGLGGADASTMFLVASMRVCRQMKAIEERKRMAEQRQRRGGGFRVRSPPVANERSNDSSVKSSNGWCNSSRLV